MAAHLRLRQTLGAQAVLLIDGAGRDAGAVVAGGAELARPRIGVGKTLGESGRRLGRTQLFGREGMPSRD